MQPLYQSVQQSTNATSRNPLYAKYEVKGIRNSHSSKETVAQLAELALSGHLDSVCGGSSHTVELPRYQYQRKSGQTCYPKGLRVYINSQKHQVSAEIVPKCQAYHEYGKQIVMPMRFVSAYHAQFEQTYHEVFGSKAVHLVGIPLDYEGQNVSQLSTNPIRAGIGKCADL